ncbi:MAG: hypothetical protein ACU0BB_07910 [Paracoccaceae bacterium]
MSRPEIVGLVREAIIEDTGAALDSFFMDANGTVPTLRPAGILSDAKTQASAGASVENVMTDLLWLLEEMIAVRARKPVLLINPLLVAALGMKTTTGTGISPFTETLARGELAGIPLIVGDTVDVTQIIAMDADSLYAGVDIPEFNLSDQATIVMADDDGVAPSHGDGDGVGIGEGIQVSDAAGTGAQVRSAFQTWETLVRFAQPVTWKLARPDVVAAITGVAY